MATRTIGDFSHVRRSVLPLVVAECDGDGPLSLISSRLLSLGISPRI